MMRGSLRDCGGSKTFRLAFPVVKHNFRYCIWCNILIKYIKYAYIWR
jgi:hypothetical protein